ncbi:MAG: hypothetical protein OXD32_03065 [Endozoicomonadaceae bacterium]|nr:hypothetical protein [Endozoicomonadaceae bacterium]MCY4328558.1 hypothetical protein [Endozoicomonadaceae bacterium]
MKKLISKPQDLLKYPPVGSFVISTRFMLLHRFLALILLVAGMAPHSYAANEGQLEKNSSASMQVIFSVPENLNIYLAEGSSLSDKDMKKNFCVLGTGIDHYRLSVSQGIDDVMGTGSTSSASFQVASPGLAKKEMVPGNNENNKLILETSRTCEQPLSLEVADSHNSGQVSHATHSGTTILTIGAE